MAVSGRVEGVETADGRVFFYPGANDYSDPSGQDFIRPERVESIRRLRRQFPNMPEGFDVGSFTLAEVDAIGNNWIPLTAEEAAHRLDLLDELKNHPVSAPLRHPSLLPYSGIGRLLQTIVSHAPL